MIKLYSQLREEKDIAIFGQAFIYKFGIFLIRLKPSNVIINHDNYKYSKNYKNFIEGLEHINRNGERFSKEALKQIEDYYGLKGFK